MKPVLDENYWNNRYLSNDFGWDIGNVSTPLKTYFDQLTDKTLRILIPGAGNAHEAEYLVNNSFTNVFICDLAREPLKNLKDRCPALPDQQLLHINFFDLDGKFDLIVEQTFFCAIHPNLRENYVIKMHGLLKPGGRLVGVLFNDPLNSDKPPFGGNEAAYRTLFNHHFNFHTFATCYNSIPPRAGRELFVNLQPKNHIFDKNS